jgi:putative MATE family efflux protein
VQVGLVLQRSVAVLSALAIPLVILWYFVYDIYMYIGVERAVCEVIKEYVYIRAWAIPVDIVNESYEKYLMSMGVMAPAMWSNVAFNICVVGFNCLFIFGFGWGFRALAISWVLSTHVMTVVLIALSLYHPSVQRTLQPLDWRALQEWKEFIVLGLPGTIMLCSEWWAFECLMLLATFLGTPQVAAQAIILQISSIVFMVPLGIGVTCASFVGNAIGAGKVTLAKQIGKLCLGYTGLLNIILGGIILLLGDQFVALFTSDPHVIYETDNAIPFLSMFVMIDGLQATASGTRCCCKIFCWNSYVLLISMPSFHWKPSMYCLLTLCLLRLRCRSASRRGQAVRGRRGQRIRLLRGGPADGVPRVLPPAPWRRRPDDGHRQRLPGTGVRAVHDGLLLRGLPVRRGGRAETKRFPAGEPGRKRT